jgi:rapamycin-insensitive companion of mTOR
MLCCEHSRVLRIAGAWFCVSYAMMLWALELLVTQLYDGSPSVAEVAAQQLERACESLEVLQIVVNMQPTLHHLGDVGQPLLMR